ncbi:hypothetical protein K438DRAFT_1784855 [Mycena galopus ATCC 62051]|nr:hypothetical protein K438DRAFT_1784855 [Mycena galopus ATCC 62051]
MLFSALVSFTFVAAFVRAQTTVPVSNIVNIQDFKGNVFGLACGSMSELSPVQTLNHKMGATAQAPAMPLGLFTIQNIAARTILSSTGAIAGLKPTTTQLRTDGLAASLSGRWERLRPAGPSALPGYGGNTVAILLQKWTKTHTFWDRKNTQLYN